MDSNEKYTKEIHSSFEDAKSHIRDGQVESAITEIRFVLMDMLGKRFSEKPLEDSECVVHYTTMDAVVQMLQQVCEQKRFEGQNNKQVTANESGAFLRMYNTVTFNDPIEGQMLRTKEFKDAIVSKYSWLGENYESLIGDGGPKAHTYSCSFSSLAKEGREEDSLQYWLLYGDSGCGCSIKTGKDNLTSGGSQLYAVQYESSQRGTFAFLEPVLDFLDWCIQSSASDPHDKKRIREEAITFLQMVGHIFKHEGYRHEKECRLIKIAGEGVTHIDKLTSPVLRRYVNGPDLRNQIFTSGSVITIGPAVPLPRNAKACLRVLLKAAGLNYVEVKVSEHDYRSF